MISSDMHDFVIEELVIEFNGSEERTTALIGTRGIVLRGEVSQTVAISWEAFLDLLAHPEVIEHLETNHTSLK